MPAPLRPTFFDRNTLTVAKELVGCCACSKRIVNAVAPAPETCPRIERTLMERKIKQIFPAQKNILCSIAMVTVKVHDSNLFDLLPGLQAGNSNIVEIRITY